MPGHRESLVGTRTTPKRRRGWIFGPVRLGWRLVSAVEARLGIPATLLLGLALLAVGLLFSLTLAGLVIGLPAMLLGAFLVVRALY